MSAVIPACETLALRLDGWCLHLTFNRPEVRNALNERMWREISGVFSAIENDRSIRAVVLRGAGGFFCAGGDMKERATIALPVEGGEDPMFARNRMGGRILTQIDRAPQAVIAVVEGAAMGGGFGMVCVSDIAFAAADARFRMPEVTLGIPPAQISPFITRRIGQSQARRLALTAAPIDGLEAAAIGLVHESVLVGAAIVGRPVARERQDGFTAEVTRLVTDGTPNACSKLYAASWRAWRAMGGRRIGTYLLASEDGTSVKAAGWRLLYETRDRPQGWDTPSRRRTSGGQGPKQLWEAP